jgi:hypothetical protein
MQAIRKGFTDIDEMYLCEYLALRIPDKNEGGRLGNGVYKELCSNVGSSMTTLVIC